MNLLAFILNSNSNYNVSSPNKINKKGPSASSSDTGINFNNCNSAQNMQNNIPTSPLINNYQEISLNINNMTERTLNKINMFY